MTKRHPTAWRKLRARMFERDRDKDAACYWCHQPIDYSLGLSSRDDYDPQAYEPDHLRPVASYPELELDPSNIVPCHAGCNRSRKDRAGLDLTGNPSRAW